MRYFIRPIILTVAAAALACCFTALAIAQSDAPPEEAPPDNGPLDAAEPVEPLRTRTEVDLKTDEEVLAALDEPTELNLWEVQLSEVAELVQRQHSFQVELDNRILTDNRSPDVITYCFRGTLRAALRHIGDQADADCILADGILLLAAKNHAANSLVLRKIDVADLCESEHVAVRTRNARDLTAVLGAGVDGHGTLRMADGILHAEQNFRSLGDLQLVLRALRKSRKVNEELKADVTPGIIPLSSGDELLERQFARSLGTFVTPLDFDSVLNFYADRLRINIMVEKSARELLNREDHSEIQISGTLANTLKQAGLACFVRDEAVVVCTPESLKKQAIFRLYQVAPIAQRLRKEGESDEAAYDRVIQKAKAVVAGSPEMDVASQTAAIHAFPPAGALAVRATWPVHERLGRWLTEQSKPAKK